MEETKGIVKGKEIKMDIETTNKSKDLIKEVITPTTKKIKVKINGIIKDKGLKDITKAKGIKVTTKGTLKGKEAKAKANTIK